jgi:DNA primase
MATPVEQVKDRLNILDVVGGYVKLAKSGKHWKGKSPFTSEKTPSFFVSPERNMYYCFSSGKGGDIFTFIQEMEGVDFKGALKILADRAGVELTPERAEDRTERETLYQILEDATRYYEAELVKHPEHIAYLTERGVTKETVAKWRIGYAPKEWRALIEHLVKLGHQPALLMKAGLAKGSERSAEPYDVFRDRVMFPICDPSGRVVGFSGRDRSGDAAAPKYVNSPETPLYEKSRILFGYDKAKSGIRTLDFTLVVEGQFDLVLSHQAGYTNTVAISGTAMTDAHVELVGRLSKRAVLALDSDKAGIASAKRSATLMLARDMDVKVARVEGGKDPADLVREDPRLLKAAIGNATHIIPFLIETIRRETDDERTMKLRVREEVVPFITMMPNRIDAEHWESEIAKAIGTTSDAIHFEVERVREEMKREEAREAQRAAAAPQSVHQSAPVTPREATPAAARFARLEDIVFHLWGVLLWQKSLESPHVSPSRLGSHLTEILGDGRIRTLEDWPADMQNRAAFLAEAAYEDTNPKALREVLEALMRELDTRIGKQFLASIRAELVEAERAGDRTRADALLREASERQKKMGKAGSEEGKYALKD